MTPVREQKKIIYWNNRYAGALKKLLGQNLKSQRQKIEKLKLSHNGYQHYMFLLEGVELLSNCICSSSKFKVTT